MEPPEIYLLPPPGKFSREELEKLEAEADKCAAVIAEFDALSHLPAEIRTANQIRKTFTQRLKRQQLVKSLSHQ